MNNSKKQYTKEEFNERLNSDVSDEQFLNWVQENENEEKLSGWMLEQWKMSSETPIEFDELSVWNKISKKIAHKRTRSTTWRILLNYSRVAAIVLPFAITIAVLGYYNQIKLVEQQVAEVCKITVPMGGKAQFFLPDSSQVWLNAGSSIEYPLNFAKEKRDVKLSGEAFFDISKDPNRPFIVNTQKMDVHVLGTSFNLSAYDNDPFVSTTLVTGKISAKLKGRNKEIEIIPGQRLMLCNDNMSYKITRIDTSLYTDWRKGKMRFERTPLNEALRKLARWYDVPIEVGTGDLADLTLTATITLEPIDKVLKLMSVALDIDYRKEGRVIILSKKKK